MTRFLPKLQGVRALLLLLPLPLLHAKDGNRFFYEAVQAEAAGNLDAAIASYQKATQIAHSANLHGNLANLHFKTGSLGFAILHYRKALHLNPDNPELKANLAHVREKAGLAPANPSIEDLYCPPASLSIWAWIASVILWAGLFAALFLIPSPYPKLIKVFAGLVWAALVAVSAYATFRAQGNAALLTREAIAVIPNESLPTDTNASLSIPLRRFAGDSTEANAQLNPGELVRIDLDENGDLKTHRSPNGSIWCLARSLSGKKGWATQQELRLILD